MKALDKLLLVNLHNQPAFDEFEQLQANKRHDLRVQQSRALEECVTEVVSIIRPRM